MFSPGGELTLIVKTMFGAGAGLETSEDWDSVGLFWKKESIFLSDSFSTLPSSLNSS